MSSLDKQNLYYFADELTKLAETKASFILSSSSHAKDFEKEALLGTLQTGVKLLGNVGKSAWNISSNAVGPMAAGANPLVHGAKKVIGAVGVVGAGIHGSTNAFKQGIHSYKETKALTPGLSSAS